MSCTIHLKIVLLLATRYQWLGGKLEGDSAGKCEGDSALYTLSEGALLSSEGKLEGDSASKREGDSASRLEGALLLATRCHCMNTSSENIKSFWVCTLDVTCQGVNLSHTLHLKI